MIEYTVRPGDTLGNIARRFARTREDVLALNPDLHSRPDRIQLGEIIRLPDAAAHAGAHAAAHTGEDEAAVADTPGEVSTDTPASADAPVSPDATAPTTSAAQELVVPHGQLTFDAEGMDVRGPYFSRILHVPPGASGVTLGRGYDMRDRKPDQIEQELTDAGVEPVIAAALQGASGLRDRAARKFITATVFDGFEIPHSVQKTLFLLAYEDLKKDVLRICSKRDVVNKYGATDWDNLDPRIRDVVVDLRYRGDYHPTSRRRLQPTLVNNDFDAFRSLIRDRGFWVAVPRDRFERRRAYLA
jgi:LysM repeat protein